MSALTVPLWRHLKLSNIILLVCWLTYSVLTFITPPRPNHFHISNSERFFMDLTFVIILGVVWYIALRGATAFKNYATMVHDAKESPGLNRIANGLLWAVAYLIMIALTGAIVQFAATTRMGDDLAVIRDHLTVLTVLIAFINLYSGSQQLADVAKFDTWDRKTLIIVSVFMVFAILFVVAFTHASAPPAGSTRNSLSVLPHSLLLFTLILPYLIGWFLGILACINITRYALRVKGLLYRQALVNLVRGIITVIALGIVFQLLNFAVRFLTSLSLESIILLLYALIALYGLGFVFIRAGAKKLTRIEVVQ